MNTTPDSRVSTHENVQVDWTPERDNPAYGAVSLDHRLSEHSSTTLRMSARVALKARDQITELLGAPDSTPAAPPQAVLKFINERPGYITACENSRNSDADYWRWQGNAAARRQLAETLGYTVPHHPGETTKPKE